MARRATSFALLLLTLFVVGCDHATKGAAALRLAHGAVVDVLPGVLDLRYAENRDTAFSIFRNIDFAGKAALLTTVTAIGLGCVLALWWRRRLVASRAEHAAFALIVAGAIGNAFDRFARGYVVDFIHLRHWPVFNVADIAICVGGAIFVMAASTRRSAALPLP